MEAMKMETNVAADGNYEVVGIHVILGDQVSNKYLLIEPEKCRLKLTFGSLAKTNLSPDASGLH